MEQALSLTGWQISDLNSASSSFIDSLNSPGKDVTLTVADSLWVNQGFELKPAFVQQSKDSYKASVTPLSFADPASVGVVNGWISDKTNKLIPKALDKLGKTDALVLVNTVYFKAPWLMQFQAKATQPAAFTTGRRQVGPGAYDALGGFLCILPDAGFPGSVPALQRWQVQHVRLLAGQGPRPYGC